MVLVKRICPPERRKATIAVSATPSAPTLSVGGSDDTPSPFQLRISLRIAETTRPGQAITIRTDGTVFCPSSARGDEDSLDTAARGTISLVSSKDPSSRRINLGKFLTNEARREEDQPADMRAQPSAHHLLTIPAEGSVEVTHDLPVSRLFLHEQKLTREDVVGETWHLGLNDGYVGTTWWCWGDLGGDLAGKHLSPWHEGMRVSPRPEVGEDWVLGLQPMELVFQDESEGAEFQFVE